MPRYEPLRRLPAETWLAIDEGERLALSVAHHRRARVKLPKIRLHAAAHLIVENQLAQHIPLAEETMERLQREGLDRHDALHAMGQMVMEHMLNLMHEAKPPGADPHERYFGALRNLTAEKWLKQDFD